MTTTKVRVRGLVCAVLQKVFNVQMDVSLVEESFRTSRGVSKLLQEMQKCVEGFSYMEESAARGLLSYTIEFPRLGRVVDKLNSDGAAAVLETILKLEQNRA